jgi:hypothetical protein
MSYLKMIAPKSALGLFFILAFLLVAAPAGRAQNTAEAPETLAQQFQNPPRQARPWVYWVWLHANTTPDDITRDLEEMKAKGIAGCILYDTGPGNIGRVTEKMVLVGKEYHVVKTDEFKDSYMTRVPTGPLQAWSPQWRELVRFAAKESARLGLDLVVADGLANTSGPITEEFGEQKMVWSSTPLSGSQLYDAILPDPSLEKSKGKARRKPGYRRDIAVLAVPDQPGFSPAKVIDLTAKMDAAGHLRWTAPAGNWTLLRFVQVSTGARNDWGYYTDSMSAKALDKTWEVTMAPLLKEMTHAERLGLHGIEDDSWESGPTYWTAAFPAEFKQWRGYDLIPYLPILADVKMSDADTRTRVRRDYELTISDLIAEYHYAHLKKLANANGLICYSEAAGPNYDQADMLKTSSRVDVAMAEFWMPSYHRPRPQDRFLLRNAASANHIYGKPLTLCESFTSLGPEWEESPFSMKNVADQAFCDGLNQVCIHAFSHSPSLTAEPGYVYFAGTHYDRHLTWWEQSPAINSYLARCSFLLQQGKFVADAIFYHGDGIGKGEPRKTIPPTLGEGYDHDNCNPEVVLTRMSARDGRIVLPDGMSYRVLVLPDNTPMSLAVLEKMAALVEAGATIVGPPPSGMAGMVLHPGDKTKFDALTARLWSGMNGATTAPKQVGAGSVFWGPTVRQVLQTAGVPPDFEPAGLSADGTMDWIHRTADDSEIYYVASRWARPEKVQCAFRVSDKQPELWNPVTGEMRDATAFRQENGRTIVPLEFGPCGSVFVVFQKTIPAGLAGKTASNYPTLQVSTTLSGPWTVDFPSGRGAPAEAVFDSLIDWTNRPEPGIKFYSGTAVYHKKFNWDAALPQGDRLLLDLGEVHEVASVRLNGRDLGVLWIKPARVDVTDAIKSGDNDLEVTVVNLWPNRLIGDEPLPKALRVTESNVHKFGRASSLWPSGLIGPVCFLNAKAPAQ